MTSLRFLRAAREEYRAAHEWYESQRSGLGQEFRDAVDEAIERIRSDPGNSAIVWPPALRQTLVHRFPYAIYYVVEADEVLVVSVFHSRRNPRVWKRRLS